MKMKNKKTRAAYHEAGHVVAGYLLEGNINKIESADIVRCEGRHGICISESGRYDRETEGVFEMFGEHENYNELEMSNFGTVDGFRAIFNFVCETLAGGVSEMLFCGLKKLPRGSMGSDFDTIMEIGIKIMPVSFNKSRLACYPELDSLIVTSVHFLKSLLTEHEYLIKNVAEALLERESLSRDAICELLSKPVTIPDIT